MEEAELAASLGYDAALLSLGALRDATVPQLIQHARSVAKVIPIIGFYLQPSVGGRLLPYSFWREFAEIDDVVAVKIAPFNRYQTLDVVRAVVESGRADDIALYTGNDDNIIIDLLTKFDFGGVKTRIVGGLLGHWAVWARSAVSHLSAVHATGDRIPASLLTLAQQVTDANTLPSRDRKGAGAFQKTTTLQRFHLPQHSRYQLRHCRMNMHRSLDNLIRSLCIHDVQYAMDSLVATSPENRHTISYQPSIHNNLHKSLRFALLHSPPHFCHQTCP